jgi:putative endonuclease
MADPQNRRILLARQGEDYAASYLEREGWDVIARNWRTRAGELDIIAREGAWLVFVEVRTRRIGRDGSSPVLGSPEESVTPSKQMRLAAIAEAYLFEMRWQGLWRIDVIALEMRPNGSIARLNHLRDAVRGNA